MKIQIKELAWHRNGICGEGFYAVLFSCEDGNMLAHVFDGPGQVAVHCLDLPTVAFGVNSWRGDQFEAALREAIKTTQSSGSIRVGPFAIPT